MWIAILLLLCLHLSDCNLTSFIMLRDEKFEGPDLRIKDEVARRQQPPIEDMDALYKVLNLSESRPRTSKVPYNSSGDTSNMTLEEFARAFGIDRRTDVNQPQMTDTTRTIIDLMMFLLYGVQRRLDDMRPILDKYENDVRFRMGNLYCTLDKWKLDLMRIVVGIGRVKNRTLDSHLMHYTHLLAKNIDITYTTEFLIFLRNEHFEALVQRMKMYHVSAADMSRYNDSKIKVTTYRS